MSVIVAVLAVTAAVPADPGPGRPRPAEVRVTQRYLVPLCLDGAAVKDGQRSWRLPPGPHALAFTMRNAPRTVTAGASAPGVATVSFTAEAGHRYEVEVRAPTTTFASRVWTRGEWRPAVRDRASDRVVSGEPDWADAPCPR